MKIVALTILVFLSQVVSAGALEEFTKSCLTNYQLIDECKSRLIGSDDVKEIILNLGKGNRIYDDFEKSFLERFSQKEFEALQRMLRHSKYQANPEDYQLISSSDSKMTYKGRNGAELVFVSSGGWKLDLDESKMGLKNAEGPEKLYALSGMYALLLEGIPHYYTSAALMVDMSIIISGITYENMPEGSIEKISLLTRLSQSNKTPQGIKEDALKAFNAYK